MIAIVNLYVRIKMRNVAGPRIPQYIQDRPLAYLLPIWYVFEMTSDVKLYRAEILAFEESFPENSMYEAKSQISQVPGHHS